ncbi:MAG: hypothetical protein LBR29_08825 [Methylobacteriaceae bacterium]|nr:hypothetical protein [Methylobacteriaceae bacterium]
MFNDQGFVVGVIKPGVRAVDVLEGVFSPSRPQYCCPRVGDKKCHCILGRGAAVVEPDCWRALKVLPPCERPHPEAVRRVARPLRLIGLDVIQSGDRVLVKDSQLERAVAALKRDGHTVRGVAGEATCPSAPDK